MNTFFTFYQRQNHANIEMGYADQDPLYWNMQQRRDEQLSSVVPQTPAPKYLLEADYTYNEDWKQG